MAKRASFDGRMLRSDRETQGYTRDALAAASGVSTSTIVRAERGEIVLVTSVERITLTLGETLDKYNPTQQSRVEGTYRVPISGEWVGFCIEAEYRPAGELIRRYVIQEHAVLRQSGSRVFGHFDLVVTVDDFPQLPVKLQTGAREVISEGRVTNDLLFFQTVTEGWNFPDGWSSCLIKASSNVNRFEGYANWQDPETDRIESSPYILIRKSGPEFEKRFRAAKELMISKMDEMNSK